MKEEIYSETPIRPAPLFLRRVSWGAIFAGLAVGLVIQMVLTVLGVAIGASTIEPASLDAGTARGYGWGAAIWFGISGIIATFCGACVAGRLSGGPRSTDGILHGVATWAVVTLVGAFLLTSAVGNFIGGAAKLLGQTVSAGGQAAAQSGGSLQNIAQTVQNMLGGGQGGLTPTGREGTNVLAQVQKNPELAAIMTRMFSKGGAAAAPQERQQAIDLLVANGMSQEQAASTVDNWNQQFQQTKQNVQENVVQAGQAVASGTSKAAWGAFVMLVLCGLAGAFGGYLGTLGLSYIRPHEHRTSTA